MAKKWNILIWISAVLFCIGCAFYLIFINGWLSFRWNTDTPEQFLSRVKPPDSVYNTDKKKLLKDFQILLKDRKDCFKVSDSSTEVSIDTIVYSPDFSRMGILIIVRNPSDMDKYVRSNNLWLYSSTSFLGMRKAGNIDLQCSGPNFVNADSPKAVSDDIRQACFRTFVQKNSDLYKYNFNDKRFWTSKIWETYFEPKSSDFMND